MRMGNERGGLCGFICVDRIKVWYWEERSEPQCNVFDRVMVVATKIQETRTYM